MANLYTVSYNTNNSTGGTTPLTQTAVSDNTTYTFVAPSAEQYGLVKTDYAFGGWSESPNATTGQYIPNQSITLSNSKPSITLYAAWVTPSTPTTKWEMLYYMQQMTPAACAEGNLTGKQLIDSRDGKRYWVAKLKDDHCWMTQDLNLDLKQGVTLNDTNSDFVESTIKSWTPGENESTITETPTTQRWPNDNTNKGYNIIRSWDPSLGTGPTYCNDGAVAGICKTSDNATTSINDDHDAQGNYYSWGAATAGEASILTSGTTGQESSRSICPKGWKLPSTNATKGGTFTALQTLYDIGKDGNKFLANPLYFLYGGFVVGGLLKFAGTGGSYWTSTSNGVANAYSLDFGPTSVIPTNSNTRYYGISVRCVAR